MHDFPPIDRKAAADSGSNDTNLKLFHADAAFSAIDDAAVAYQSPSLIAAGSSAQQVSILSTLINLAMAALCLKAPHLIFRAGLAKRGAVILSFLNLCAWVPLAMVFLISGIGITPIWLALVWFINLAPGLLISVQRDNWLAKIVPVANLNRYLGQRMAIKSAFYLGGFLMLGYIMDNGPAGLTGFLIVCTIAAGTALIDFIILSFMKETPSETAASSVKMPPAFTFPAYISELKEKRLGKFVTYTTFIYLTVGFSGPLYAVYMLQDLHLNYVTFTIIVACEFLARIISMPLWSRLSDKIGNIQVLGIVSRMIPFIPILWLLNSHAAFLITVQLISGCCWGAFDLNTQSYLLKVAPREKKLWYIVYSRCLILFSTALGGFIGALSVGSVMPVFGSSNLGMFLLSGIARVFIVFGMVPKLIDTIHNFSRTARVRQRYGKPVTSNQWGTYYRQKESEESSFLKTLQPVRQHVPVILHNIKPRRQAVTKYAAKPASVDVSYDGLYYRQPRHTPGINIVSPLPESAGPGSRSALFHDEQRWKRYFRESLASIMNEDREAVRHRPVAASVY